MALQAIVTLQGDTVWCAGDQVVIGDADPIVIRPAWAGQSPGIVWHEWDESTTTDPTNID